MYLNCFAIILLVLGSIALLLFILSLISHIRGTMDSSEAAPCYVLFGFMAFLMLTLSLGYDWRMWEMNNYTNKVNELQIKRQELEHFNFTEEQKTLMLSPLLKDSIELEMRVKEAYGLR